VARSGTLASSWASASSCLIHCLIHWLIRSLIGAGSAPARA
jgi:hypothetical protein